MWSRLFVLFSLFLLLPTFAIADDYYDTSVRDDELFIFRLNLTDGTASVTGLRKSMRHVEIPAGVHYQDKYYAITSIGEAAFKYNDSIRTVIIPASVTGIGEEAFCKCKNLYHVSLPGSLTGIGRYAFSATGLTDVTIPGSVSEILEYAFNMCSSLVSVTFLHRDNAPLTVSTWAFRDCKELQEVHISDLACWCNTNFGAYDSNPLQYACRLYLGDAEVEHLVIPDGVKCIKPYAFYCCHSLKTLETGDSTQVIETGAFSYCRNLDSAVLRNSVDSIGLQAFSDCSNLRTLTISKSLKAVANSVFSGCDSLESVHISDLSSWLNIDFYDSDTSNPLYFARHFCLNGEEIKNLVIPDDVSAVKQRAFYGCRSLETIVFSDSIRSIDRYAFTYCDNLKEITFGRKYFTLGANCFQYASNLAIVNSPLDNPPVIHGFDGVSTKTTLYVPEGKAKTYRSCGWGSYFKNIVEVAADGELILSTGDKFNVLTPEGIAILYKVIDTNAKTCQVGDGTNVAVMLKSVAGDINIPAEVHGYTVKTVAASAFQSCQNITGLTLPNSVGVIEKRAFSGCSSLKDVALPDNDDLAIGEYAFSSCSSLETVLLPRGSRVTGHNPFGSCSLLREITIAAGNPFLLSDRGVICSADMRSVIMCPVGTELSEYAIPSGVQSIEVSAFYGCKNLRSIHLPTGLKQIKSHAFGKCTGLTTIELPSSLEQINAGVFANVDFTKVISRIKNPFQVAESVFSSNTYASATLTVPAGTLSLYQSVGSWKNFVNIEELVVRQTLALSQGWNWISTYIKQSLPVGELPEEISRVASQEQEAIRDPQFGLVGSLDSITPGPAYKLWVDAPCTITLQGGGFADTTIALHKGWNWVGTLTLADAPIAEALTGVEEGDQLVGRDASATYSGGQWTGTLAVVRAGEGYLYRSVTQKTLVRR